MEHLHLEKKNKKRKRKEKQLLKIEHSETSGCECDESKIGLHGTEKYQGHVFVVGEAEASIQQQSQRYAPKSWASWSEAFRAAASIQHVEIDEDFLRRTNSSRNKSDQEEEEEDTDSRGDIEDRIGARKVSKLVSDFYQSKNDSCMAPYPYHEDSQYAAKSTLDTKSTQKVKDKKRKKKRKHGRTLDKNRPDVSSNHSEAPISLKKDPIPSNGTLTKCL